MGSDGYGAAPSAPDLDAEVRSLMPFPLSVTQIRLVSTINLVTHMHIHTRFRHRIEEVLQETGEQDYNPSS
jgi:hypothetical protein